VLSEDMASLTTTYNVVWNLIKATWRDIHLHRLIDQEKFVTTLEANTIQLQKAWRNSTPQVYNAFVESHLSELVQIRKLLTGKNRQMYFNRRYHARLTTCNTQIFSNAFRIAHINARFSHLPTAIFAEFVKGITFFKSDVTSALESPPYHRPLSCGSANRTFLQKFEITGDMSVTNVNRRKRALRICYFERMIYNNIYEYVLDKQDMGHRIELQQLERLYQDYYPDHKLTVDTNIGIGPVYQLDPTFLMIIDSYGDNKFHAEETYEKQANGEVHCMRKLLRNIGHSTPFEVKKESKTQSYANEVPWSSRGRRTNSI
jgi:hypothetical protein